MIYTFRLYLNQFKLGVYSFTDSFSISRIYFFLLVLFFSSKWYFSIILPLLDIAISEQSFLAFPARGKEEQPSFMNCVVTVKSPLAYNIFCSSFTITSFSSGGYLPWHFLEQQDIIETFLTFKIQEIWSLRNNFTFLILL